LVAFIPLIFGITLVTFVLVRLLPGDPARALAGNTPFQGTVENIRHWMGLDRPLWEQYLVYLQHVFHGDLGDSWVTGNPVTVDLAARAPATLELITYGLLTAVLLGVSLGIIGGLNPGSAVDRIAQTYGFLAGAVPDFWLALLVILVAFSRFHLIPPPLARLPQDLSPPHAITGFYTVDALLSSDLRLLRAAVAQLVGPVLTLCLLNAPLVSKLTRASMEDILRSDFIRYARACGLPKRVIAGCAFRNILPPLITLVGFLYAFLVGGAVLVESVFSWNGMGQYAVQSVINRDYAPIQGFVLIVGVFSLAVYLVIDVAYMLVDPRIRLQRPKKLQ
jgi:peptide/nickel transport system permease protein